MIPISCIIDELKFRYTEVILSEAKRASLHNRVSEYDAIAGYGFRTALLFVDGCDSVGDPYQRDAVFGVVGDQFLL